MYKRHTICSAVIAVLTFPALARAADDPVNGALEEVVVSAFRRASVIELDASITVLNAETIATAAVENFEELISLIPNMNYSGDGSRARYFQLRGIGELEQYEGAPNPSVGFIVDDIDLSGIGGSSSLFDMNRVEILRGPQATRFGANALAGLIYLQSAEPTQELRANAELMVGNENTWSAGAAIGGPLAAAVSGRVSVNKYYSDGFYNNLSLGVEETNQRDELTVRAKLRWDINQGWSVKLSLLALDYHNGYDAWTPENGRLTYSDNPGEDTQETLAGSLRIDGALGTAVELVSITAYADTDVLFSFDGEWGDAAYWAPYGYDYVYADRRSRENWSQEIRLLSAPDALMFNDSTSWVIGLYGQRLKESNDIVSQGIYDDSADEPFSFCMPCIDSTRLFSTYESKNYAIFGKLDSQLSERLSLSAGVRLERWKADYQDLFIDEIYGDPDNVPSNSFSPRENLWGGELSLNYQLAGGSRVYVRVSRGYKAGGFNPSLARAFVPSVGLGPEAITFDPETLINYEAGIKGLNADAGLRFDVTAFYMDRKDMQVRSSAQFTDNPNDFIFITSNAQGHSYGLEATLNWQFQEDWTLHGALGLLESKIDQYGLDREADIEGELIGREFAHAPSYTANIGLSWHSDLGWLARLDINASGGFFYDYSHDEKSSSYRTVNLRLGREWTRWAVNAWVRNLFDESYKVRGFSFGLQPPWFSRTLYTRLADPRHYGVTVSYRY